MSNEWISKDNGNVIIGRIYPLGRIVVMPRRSGVIRFSKICGVYQKNVLKTRKESGTYLATDSRHRWKVQMTMKKDK